MLKLKHQYSGHLMQRMDSLEKTLTLGKIEGRREREHAVEHDMIGWHQAMSLRKLEIVKDRESCYAAVPGILQRWI